MKDIKEKVRDKNPKIRNPASRLPKELVRSAMLETKEKSRMAADKVGRETGEESPVEYAGNRIERVEQRAGNESASAAYRGVKKLAVKTAPRMVKASPVSSQKVKTQAILQKKHALTSMRAAREAKRAAMGCSPRQQDKVPRQPKQLPED